MFKRAMKRAEATAERPSARNPAIDRLGALVAGLVLIGLAAGPFATLKPNRILDGAPKNLFEALSAPIAAVVLVLAVAAAVAAFLKTPPFARLAASAAALVALTLALGAAPAHLTPAGDALARVAPGWGFWLVWLAFALLAADASSKRATGPAARVTALAVAFAAAGALLASGALDGLSIMKEYASRSGAFWAEGRTHVALALGSVVAALAIGVPFGLACHRSKRLAGPTIAALTAVQTIPSIALFGLLIGPLAWIAAHVPGAAAAGVSGVGATPAFVALTLYALLPVVSSVVVGLSGAPRDAVDAGRGAGMTERRILLEIEAPLALTTFLAGLRITLVQTIGLATVAALIGGGGFGVFVFQGVGQTAIDLVLLGAVPTVALAFAAAVLLDAAADALRRAP